MRGKTLLQINATANWGSTGRIAEQIGCLAQQYGWDCHVVYGRYVNESNLQIFKAETRFGVYWHYLINRVLDMDGLLSSNATSRTIKYINAVKPDIIHLHNIHDHWLNYEMLFNYLSVIDTPVVWTQHDCWSFTGGCYYYSIKECNKWISGCSECPFKNKLLPLIDKTRMHFEKKKILFNSIPNLTLVPVSHWLEGEIRKSFLGKNQINVIYNGVDTSLFYPYANNAKIKYGIKGKSLIVGAATAWSERKGLYDYIRLREFLSDDTIILLVGLSKLQIKQLPIGIIGLERVNSLEELAFIYSSADIIMNLSYEETFGLTTVEGLSCGTPGIVYNTTASPELITPETGLVVELGNINAVANAVKQILSNGKNYYTKACRQRAIDFFNKNDRFLDYIRLYESLLTENNSV